MRPALAASAALAALVHGFVLFGLDVDRPATPLPATTAPVVVALIAAAPAAPSGSASASPAPPTPAPPPPPEPPRAKRAPEPTRPRVARKPEARPAPAVEAPKATAPTLEGGTDGGATTGDSGATPRAEGDGARGATQVSAVPRYRMAPAPEYPASARRLRQEGVVLLAVEVSAEGRPTSVAIARSSGVASLDAAAVRGVRRWRFDPARSAGVPFASRVEVPIRFSLTD